MPPSSTAPSKSGRTPISGAAGSSGRVTLRSTGRPDPSRTRSVAVSASGRLTGPTSGSASGIAAAPSASVVAAGSAA